MAEPVAHARILIVDDNQQIHEDFRKVLTRAGCDDELGRLERELFGTDAAQSESAEFALDSCFQGEDAVAAVRRAAEAGRPYALAFVDMRMPPGWDGVRTIAEVWRVDPRLEVVICSAHSDYSWDEIVGTLGTTDQLLILKKPFELIEVRQLAHALTRKWELAREAEQTLGRLKQQVEERTRGLEERTREVESALETLHRTQAQLIQTEKLASVGQLAAGIAHEINTPAQYVGDNLRFAQQAIHDLLEVLEASNAVVEIARQEGRFDALVAKARAAAEAADLVYLRAELLSALNQSIEGVGRVSEIVRALKSFAHPGSDRREIDLNQALESTIVVARNEWKDVARLETDLDPELPPVRCLPGEINQAFLNILVNAAHAVADARALEPDRECLIRVTTRASDGWVEVSISDTGVGIPVAVQPRVFELFFTTKEVGRGSGQGLAIAHDVIVNKHRGQIRFESEPGDGTTFHLRLPIEAAGE